MNPAIEFLKKSRKAGLILLEAILIYTDLGSLLSGNASIAPNGKSSVPICLVKLSPRQNSI